MATTGIKGLLVETRDYAAAKAFWTSLGFENVFETGHGSGQFVHPSGGPYVFVNQVPEGRATLTQHPILGVDASGGFAPDPPADFSKPWVKEHWGVMHALIRDPDGRDLALDAPE